MRSMKTHDCRSNKIYNSELTMTLKYEIKYSDEVGSNHGEHNSHFIEEVTWSNLGLIRVLRLENDILLMEIIRIYDGRYFKNLRK